jgi:hypothetical protein
MPSKQPVKDYLQRKKQPSNRALTPKEVLDMFPHLVEKWNYNTVYLGLLVKTRVLIGEYKSTGDGSKHKQLYIEVYSLHRLIDFVNDGIEGQKVKAKK